eukprot:NODE_1883_length_1370_cov_16.662377_g1704_i0.p1 GENE.NODE_1883_length_1370_cov_16.662377_g1704_i0~~NODE_1883_length_1370_cov_16.662377_g1704_i0.p1  ORF type:complete len:398 (-),score=110.22 NODE_1883_length_1370_cov_16.662377_g1704_i0:176-1288(-)
MAAILTSNPIRRKKEKRRQQTLERLIAKEDAERGIISRPKPTANIREPKQRRRRTTEEKRAERKKKKALMRVVKKRKLKRPVFVSVPDMPDEDRDVPPHSWKLNMFKRALELTVWFRGVPADYIVCDPTETRINISTPKWSRKWNLDAAYPDGVVVDPHKATAEMGRYKFVCTLPFTKLPDKAMEKHRKVANAIRAQKDMRFSYDEFGVRHVVMKAPKTVYPQAASQLTASDAQGLPRKKKVFLESKGAMMELAEEAAAAQQAKTEEAQAKMTVWQEMKEEKREAREVRKLKQAAIKDKTLKGLVEQKKHTLDETAAAHAPPLAPGRTASDNKRRKVSFASTTEVVRYTRDEEASKKQRKGKAASIIEYK